MNEFVALGDQTTCKQIRQAVSKHNLPYASEGELEIQDEFDCRRWFSRNSPKGTFICLGLETPFSAAHFLFSVAGTLNVIRAALGNSHCLVLASYFPSNEFFLFSQLVSLLRHEKKVEFWEMTGNQNEPIAAFAERCVLFMQDVSAKEANQDSSKGSQQRREVPVQVLSKPQGGQQHGAATQPLLEVPVAAAPEAAPGDVCAQPAADKSAEARNTVLANPGAIS
jgi:hypothetical protein